MQPTLRRASRASVAILLAAVPLIVVRASQPHSAESVVAGPLRFEERVILDGYGYAYGIAAADLDGDGDLDLTSAETTGDELYWFENDGAGSLTRHFIYRDDPGWFERHDIGDVDGDGNLDVVIVKNSAHGVLWFRNSGEPSAGTWERYVVTEQDFPYAYDVTLGDFDGDGDLDVAGSSYSRGNRFAWFENPGRPTAAEEWSRHWIEEDIGGTRTIAAVDVNRDGRVDLMGTARVANLVLWYENTGETSPDQRWRRRVIDAESAEPVHGHPVDMDGDGDVDFMLALGMHSTPEMTNTNHVAWYENVGAPGDGSAWTKHLIGELRFAFEAVAGDLDGDGDLDAIATAWGGDGQLAWFENPGRSEGDWNRHFIKETWPKANQVIVMDLDQDGRLDIAAVAERGSNEFLWWRNRGPTGP